MRAIFLASLGIIVVATSASAQVQQNNPNAANQSMETNSQLRSLRQEGTTQNDTTMMNIQRNQAATPAPNTGPAAVGSIGGGTGIRR